MQSKKPDDFLNITIRCDDESVFPNLQGSTLTLLSSEVFIISCGCSLSEFGLVGTDRFVIDKNDFGTQVAS